MRRRKFIIGMGALTAGGAAAIGTGAYSAAEMNRNANIDVVNDAEGLLALRVGNAGDGVVSEENGELAIDFTADGNAGGVNVNSRYQAGHFGKYNWMPPADKLGPPASAVAGDPHELPAFSIVNQDTAPHAIELDYEFDDDPGGSKLFVMASTRQAEVEATSGTNIPRREQWYSDTEGGSLVFDDDNLDHRLSQGGRIGVSLFVDTRQGSTVDDLSGTMTIRGR